MTTPFEHAAALEEALEPAADVASITRVYVETRYGEVGDDVARVQDAWARVEAAPGRPAWIKPGGEISGEPPRPRRASRTSLRMRQADHLSCGEVISAEAGERLVVVTRAVAIVRADWNLRFRSATWAAGHLGMLLSLMSRGFFLDRVRQ